MCKALTCTSTSLVHNTVYYIVYVLLPICKISARSRHVMDGLLEQLVKLFHSYAHVIFPLFGYAIQTTQGHV